MPYSVIALVKQGDIYIVDVTRACYGCCIVVVPELYIPHFERLYTTERELGENEIGDNERCRESAVSKYFA